MPQGNKSYSCWQIVFIGLLPSVTASRYATTIIGTFTGLLLPPETVCHHVICFLTGYVLVTVSPPDVIDSNLSSHFTFQDVQSWALEHGILWNFYSAYQPQPAGLMERHNGLLEDMLLKLLNNKWSPKWTEMLPQALILLNSEPSDLSTPTLATSLLQRLPC